MWKQRINTWIGAALILSVGLGAVFVITKAAKKGTSEFGYLPSTARPDSGETTIGARTDDTFE